jgi:hypothetical protein
MNLDTVTSASEMGEQFNSSDDNNVIGPEQWFIVPPPPKAAPALAALAPPLRAAAHSAAPPPLGRRGGACSLAILSNQSWPQYYRVLVRFLSDLSHIATTPNLTRARAIKLARHFTNWVEPVPFFVYG